MVKIGRYNYEKSTNPNKKLMVVVEKDGKKRTIHFGNRKAPANEHFFDKTRIWKSLDHGDKERRKNYLSRSAGIKNKEGKLTKDDPFSPNYHARRILW
tara:strand:+ start:4929 stop:5222 length:294 start_codon:yes stop_codon:yes gene_type:complete